MSIRMIKTVAAKKLLLALLMMNSGCLWDDPGPMTWKADGRYVPRRWSREIPLSAQDQAKGRVHYDSVYISDPEFLNLANSPKQYGRKWYRFWPGGEVMWQGSWTDQPDVAPRRAEDMDNFRGGHVGRYCVIGEKIKMEYVAMADDGRPYFYHVWGRINDDGSLSLEGDVLGYGYHVPPWKQTFKRELVDGMRRYPDW